MENWNVVNLLEECGQDCGNKRAHWYAGHDVDLSTENTGINHIGFYHGAMCEPYEIQANKQGFTLGRDRERLEKLGFSLVYSWIHGCLTDSQYDMALRKLNKQLAKAVKPLQEPQKEV